MSDVMLSVSLVAALAAVLVFTIRERKVVLREGPYAMALGVMLVVYAAFSYDATERLANLCSYEVVVPGYSALESFDFEAFTAQVRAGVPPDTTTVTMLYEEFPEYCR